MALFDPARALFKMDPRSQIVVLIDALDEISYHDDKENILKWLTNCSELPPNVRFVLSSRPPDDALTVFCDKQARTLQCLTIKSEDWRVKLDVETYARRLATRHDVAAELVRFDIDTDGFVAQAVKKANGNIGYLDAIERALNTVFAHPNGENRTMTQALLELAQLPDELGELYGEFLRQIKAAVARQRIELIDPETNETYDKSVWPAIHYRILGVLAVALAPLNLDQIMALGSINAGREYVVEAINWLIQFLDTEQGGYRLYHATLAEFLTSATTKEQAKTTDLWIDAAAQNRQIADYYWRIHKKEWGRCDAYGLNSLAAHMTRGNRANRLPELICQDWMNARFGRSGCIYDGFLADLDLAWRHADQVALQESADGKEPVTIANCFRYALIRTSINSVASNLTDKMVITAVKTGRWSIEQGLSVATLTPNKYARVRLYAGLLGLDALTDSQQYYDVSAKGLAAAQAINRDYSQAEALVELAPYLTGDLLREGITTARAINFPIYRAKALLHLSMQLTGEAREQGVAESLAAGRAGGNYESWASTLDWFLFNMSDELTVAVGEQILAEYIAAVRAIRNPFERVKAIARLFFRLGGEVREQVLAEGLADAWAIDRKRFRTSALKALAPHLSGRLIWKGLAAAVDIDDEKERADALKALLPRLTGEMREQIVLAAWSIEEDPSQRMTLEALVPHLSGELLWDRLAAVLGNGVVAFLKVWNPKRCEAFLKIELEEMWNINSKWCLRILEESVPYLREMTDAQATTQAVTNLKSQNSANSDSLTYEANEQELEKALVINDQWDQARALAVLAEQLQGEVRDQVLADGLAAARSADWRGLQRADALAALAVQLKGREREQAVLESMEALALEEHYEAEKAKIIATLSPYLSDWLTNSTAKYYWALSCWLSGTINVENVNVDILAALIPHLEGAMRDEAIRTALEVALGTEPGWGQTNELAILAAYLTEEYRQQILKDGLAKMAQTDKDQKPLWVGALINLIPQLKGEAREQAIAECLTATLALNSGKYQAEILMALAPQLTGEKLAIGLKVARDIDEAWYQAQALASLAPRFEDVARAQVVAKGLEAAQSVGDQRGLAIALSFFCSLVADETSLLSQIRGALITYLYHDTGSHVRSLLLSIFANKGLFAPPVMSAGTIGQIASHIIEICDQWHWPITGQSS